MLIGIKNATGCDPGGGEGWGVLDPICGRYVPRSSKKKGGLGKAGNKKWGP